MALARQNGSICHCDVANPLVRGGCRCGDWTCETRPSGSAGGIRGWSGGSGTHLEMIAHILDQMTADGEVIDWWGRASTRPRLGEPSKGLQSDHQPSD